MLQKSESISSLVPALVAAQAGIRHALKDGKNPHFRSEYATLESVIEAVKLPLLTQGLVVLQTPDHSAECGSSLLTTLAHSSGEWISSRTAVLNEKGTAQGMGSGLTYARRYALAAMLMIGQADDDGHDATHPAPLVASPAARPAPVAPVAPVKAPAPVDPKASHYAAIKASGWKRPQLSAYCKAAFGCYSAAELSAEQLGLLASVVSKSDYSTALAEFSPVNLSAETDVP